MSDDKIVTMRYELNECLDISTEVIKHANKCFQALEEFSETVKQIEKNLNVVSAVHLPFEYRVSMDMISQYYISFKEREGRKDKYLEFHLKITNINDTGEIFERVYSNLSIFERMIFFPLLKIFLKSYVDYYPCYLNNIFGETTPELK